MRCFERGPQMQFSEDERRGVYRAIYERRDVRDEFLEEEIPRVEASIAHTEEQLGVYVSAAETQRLTDLAAGLREQLAALTAEWEELMLQLDGA